MRNCAGDRKKIIEIFERFAKFLQNDPNEIEYKKSPEDVLKDADVCFIFTEWDEIKNIKPNMYKELMKEAIVYDGRNIYTLDEMKNNHIEYHSIGRPSII